MATDDDAARGEPLSDNPIADLMPTDPLMVAPWAACLAFTISRPGAIEAFQRDTGNTWTPSRTPLDRLIDKASGAELECVRAFVRWHNETIWGDLDLVAGGETT